MNLKEIDYKREPEKYQYRLYELQRDNLMLSNKQLRRYFLYSIISFLAGSLSSFAISKYTSTSKSEKELILESKMITLEQTVNQLEDSIQNVKALHTTLLDSLKKN